MSRPLNPTLYKFFLKFTDKSEISNTLQYNKKEFNKYLNSFLFEKKITKNNYFKNEILYFLTKGIEPLLSSLDANSMFTVLKQEFHF